MFELASPWWFLLLPLPFLVWRYLPPQSNSQQASLRVPFFHNMTHIVGQQSPQRASNQPLILLSLVWLLVVTALANPRWVGPPQAIQREGRNILMAVDVSGSMQINDMQLRGRPTQRLDIVKLAAKLFINKRQGDRLGLILFGSKAYLQTPLTYDRQTVLHMLNDATVGLAGQRTNIGDAIGLAVKRLQAVPKKSRLLILLTDGSANAGSLTPMSAAELAQSDGIKIYTIGLGAEQMIVPGFFTGQAVNPSADLDEKTLIDIARLTGGRYFRATDTQELAKIYQEIDKLEPVKTDVSYFRPITLYYYWPLGIACGLFLLLLLRLSIQPKEALT